MISAAAMILTAVTILPIDASATAVVAATSVLAVRTIKYLFHYKKYYPAFGDEKLETKLIVTSSREQWVLSCRRWTSR